MEPEFYTPKDAAKKLSVSIFTILNLIKTGRLSAINVGSGKRNMYRIPAHKLEAFIKNPQNEPASPSQPAQNQETQ